MASVARGESGEGEEGEDGWGVERKGGEGKGVGLLSNVAARLARLREGQS